MAQQKTGCVVTYPGAARKAKSRRNDQGTFLYPDLIDQLNPSHPLLKRARQIPWQRFEEEFDGHTLPDVLEQTWQITETCPEVAICDRGYRGRKQVGDTKILIPGRPKKSDSPYQRRKARERFRRRAGIEPVISHLKHDFRMARNFLRGVVGDAGEQSLNRLLKNSAKLGHFGHHKEVADGTWSSRRQAEHDVGQL